MEGDGHTYKDGFSRYGTISLRLANDISRLAVHCGWSGIIKISSYPGEYRHTITGTKGYNKGNSHIIESKIIYYKISIIRKQNQPYINKKINNSNEEKLIDYEGKVYCIEMPSSHLYYMREHNFAPSMLIGNSRAGQKGTIGLIIPESSMPFTSDGVKPDLIINPHALPSRMTIGQIIECLFGKACTSYGSFGDCTAFQIKGPNYDMYGKMLVDAGFHSSGNQLLYNGMTGEQIDSDIYIGPTYYMRLKHMVKDKINFRNRGPNTMLTRQPVQGRANDGGLRIGEMERDGVLAHGMSYFLNESFMIRADEYYMAICNKTGCIAIYNEPKNLFLSPYADGPINFHTNPDDTMNIKNISKCGRSFSLLRIPYSFKLLIQELLVMNIQLRVITENNVEQLNNMCYSTNINKLLNNSNSLDVTVKDYINDVKKILTESEYSQYNKQSIVPNETPELPTLDKGIGESIQDIGEELRPYPPESPPYPPESTESSPTYAPYSPAYVPESPIDIQEVKLSNDNQSPVYRPNINSSSNSNNNINENIQDNQNNKSILEVEELVDNNQSNKGDDNIEGQDSTNKDINSENSSNQEKKVIINLDKNETINDDNSNNSKKIIL